MFTANTNDTLQFFPEKQSVEEYVKEGWRDESTNKSNALEEDPDSLSSTHMSFIATQSELQGSQYLLLTSVATRHPCGAHT